ncbi:MAG TPA: hypothetical protein VK277_06890 [Acidimicrobiales bacterium]|nr:hypothetical protein [Acidimicrobiales bacterium]
MSELRLGEFCQARSGDKADVANIAVFAPTEDLYAVLRDQLTEDRVAEHLAPLVAGPVTRYEAGNVLALNFVCQLALGGGGPRSLRSDMLGKTLGPNLLRMTVEVPDHLMGDLPRLRPPGP